jgi:hypothetical protein
MQSNSATPRLEMTRKYQRRRHRLRVNLTKAGGLWRRRGFFPSAVLADGASGTDLHGAFSTIPTILFAEAYTFVAGVAD